MKSTIFFATLLISLNAFSYVDGKFNCKNIEGIPDSVYTITTGKDGIPLVDITRYYRVSKDSPIVESNIKGYAAVVQSSEGLDALVLQGVTLEFENNKIVNCK